MAVTHSTRTQGSPQIAYDPSPSSGSRLCPAGRLPCPPPIAGASCPAEQSEVNAELSRDSRSGTRRDSSRTPRSSRQSCVDLGGCTTCGLPLLMSKPGLVCCSLSIFSAATTISFSSSLKGLYLVFGRSLSNRVRISARFAPFLNTFTPVPGQLRSCHSTSRNCHKSLTEEGVEGHHERIVIILPCL